MRKDAEDALSFAALTFAILLFAFGFAAGAATSWFVFGGP